MADVPFCVYVWGCVYTTSSLSIHILVSILVGCFHSLAIANDAVMNIGIYVFVCESLSRVRLCDPMASSWPGYVHGIRQTSALE